MQDQSRGRYVELEVPEFKSTLPTHLLGKLSDSERYIVEALSKLENQSDFLVRAAVAGNHQNIDIDSRLVKLENWHESMILAEEDTKEQHKHVKELWDWHNKLSGKWFVIWALIIIVVPFILKLAWDVISRHI